MHMHVPLLARQYKLSSIKAIDALELAESKLSSWEHTHTHNRFTALLEYVRDHPGEQKGTRKVKPIWIYWSKR